MNCFGVGRVGREPDSEGLDCYTKGLFLAPSKTIKRAVGPLAIFSGPFFLLQGHSSPTSTFGVPNVLTTLPYP